MGNAEYMGPIIYKPYFNTDFSFSSLKVP